VEKRTYRPLAHIPTYIEHVLIVSSWFCVDYWSPLIRRRVSRTSSATGRAIFSMPGTQWQVVLSVRSQYVQGASFNATVVRNVRIARDSSPWDASQTR